MLIISGHDNTVSKQEIFLIYLLGLTLDYFRFPSFASQVTFEITRNDDEKNRIYSDYFVNYYFNDELIANLTMKNFLIKLKQICGQKKRLTHFEILQIL